MKNEKIITKEEIITELEEVYGHNKFVDKIKYEILKTMI